MGKLKKCPFCGGIAIIRRRNPDHIMREKCFVCCVDCKGKTKYYDTENEAIEAWNYRVEQTSEVVEHVMIITDTDGNKYKRSEYLCGSCKKKVLEGDEYCSHCGEQLDWRHL